MKIINKQTVSYITLWKIKNYGFHTSFHTKMRLIANIKTFTYFYILVKLDLSQNSIRRLSEKSFSAVQNTIEDLRLAGNLLGDALNPIFSTTEFHGLTRLIRLDLSENRISTLEEGILKGCVHLEVKTSRDREIFLTNCFVLNCRVFQTIEFVHYRN